MKTFFLKALLCCLIAVSISNFASAEDNLPLVTVTGKGEVKVTPDEVVINFGIEESDKDLEVAKKQLDGVVERIRKLISERNIDSNQVKIDFLRIYPRYTKDEKNNSTRIYEVSQGISIVLKDISQYEDFISSLLKIGVNSIRNVGFRTSEPRKYKDKAREIAVIAAREKAVALATTLGQTVGKAFSIEENSYSSYNEYSNSFGGIVNSAVESEQGEPIPISGQISITANVTVKFYLK